MNKTTVQLFLSGASIAALLIALGCSNTSDRRVTQLAPKNRPSVVQTSEGLDTYGRLWGEQEVVKKVSVTTRETGVSEIKTDVVTLSKRVPNAVGLEEQYPSELTVKALEDAGQVTVTDMIPDGAKYLRSEPDAAQDGNLLSWKFASMEKGEVKTIRSYFKAEKEGTLASCCTVSAMPRTCASTFVGKPALTLTKTGPATAQLGQDITYTTTVANHGTLPARNVVVTDKVPDGLTHASGQYELSFKVGDLEPNQSKEIPVVLKAMQRGTVVNNVFAMADNAPQVGAQAPTLIQQPGLALFKSGDPEQFLNRKASYTIIVTNTGDTTLKNVEVVDTAAEPTTFVSADGGKVDHQTATWLLSELAPGHAKTFKTTLTSKVTGTYRNQVAATAMGMKEVAQVTTLWKGLAALAIEVIDDNDPVQVGESTTYTIRVTNQGSADETNIGLKIAASDEIIPIRAEGLTVEGQTMTVSSIPSLGPKQSVTYKVTVEGKKAGDARLKVKLTADGLSAPVIEEESTRVY